MVLGSVGNIEIIRHGSEIPEARRDFLLDRIESIMASNWHFTKRHWSREDSPFHDEYGLVFASTNAEIVGYSIYKRLVLDGTPALYRAGAAVAVSHQRDGFYRRMSQAILTTEWSARPGVEEMYLAWRTRNPLIWAANARLCKAVVPSIVDGQMDAQFQEVCLRLAHQLYPDCPIEPPAMIMRNVYEHLTYIDEPYDHFASPISAWYANAVPNPGDAVFSVGTVQKLAADASSPEAST
jgi:hypothetical protein